MPTESHASLSGLKNVDETEKKLLRKNIIGIEKKIYILNK